MINTVVHVTHEAVEKIGGIGAVLEGLLTSGHYQKSVARTILIQPLFNRSGGADDRLGPDGEVLYSSLDGRLGHQYGPAFARIEAEWNTDIVYGHRTFGYPGAELTTQAEVVLIDVSRMDVHRINHIKRLLWDHYQLQSDRYEHSWEFDQYVKLAGPALACLQAVGAAPRRSAAAEPGPGGSGSPAKLKLHKGTGDHCVVISHEFMGMPTALLAAADPEHDYRTAFYAHEVATMRRLVETSAGYDTMFYNVLGRAIEQDRYVEGVFGDQHPYFKHPLVARARLLDNVLAVGDYVIKELRFMGSNWSDVQVDLSYNGIPAERVSMERKLASRGMIREYCRNLLGHEPDYIFTHVTRMAVSKGLWRDLSVLEHMDRQFEKRGWRGVLLVLSCGAAPRRPGDVRQMEADYGWPAAHRFGLPDLSDPEADYYAWVQLFNARARNIKAIFINQFGFSRDLVGQAVPEGTTFHDLRIGTDVEFGQSIYEPFGIAMLEPLTYGGLCVISSVCGCRGFVDNVTGGADSPNVIVADYTDLNGRSAAGLSLEDLLAMNRDFRRQVERKVSARVAETLVGRLPVDDAAREALLASGYELARQMSWDVVARDYFLPALDRACRRERTRQMSAG
ncbi:MAG: hypothetical protein BIFFINMI_02534 [Phycisphaerae bacterium]|nr:hypothetical protein [Phycisphaerae bacterium]